MKFKTKGDVRRFVWSRIKEYALPPFPVEGRIPNFKGSYKACERLRGLERYTESKIVFSAPDSPLRRAREIVLEDGKTLLAVKPRLKGFLILKGRADVTIRGMIRDGMEIEEDRLPEIGSVDVFIQGCVAIDRMGNRIGKGSGFGDREYRILQSAGILKDCLYVVIAHEVQIFEDLSYLVEKHDVGADVILTPKNVIWCR
jgi:5-formyltetrahydrofolate cyclo-ligase